MLAPTSSGTTRYSITSAKMKSRTTRRAGLASSDSQGRHSRQRLGDWLWPAPGPPASSPATGGSLPSGGSPATGGPPATGGSLATGGSPATGGSLATGGLLAARGSLPAGGSLAAGGSSATG